MYRCPSCGRTFHWLPEGSETCLACQLEPPTDPEPMSETVQWCSGALVGKRSDYYKPEPRFQRLMLKDAPESIGGSECPSCAYGRLLAYCLSKGRRKRYLRCSHCEHRATEKV